MYLVKSAFRDWSRRFFGFSQGAFRPVPLFSLWARASASMRCSRTSIRSWIAMGGLAVSCSTSCCCGTDTVPQPSNTMRVGHTREAWSHGRWQQDGFVLFHFPRLRGTGGTDARRSDRAASPSEIGCGNIRMLLSCASISR